MNFIHSTLDALRDRYAPVTHTSTFRSTGQVTPEEFVLAGDFLVYKFPSWSWSAASSPSKRVAYLPDDKQFLVTRGVPCRRRLDDNFIGASGAGETVEKDGFAKDAGADGDDGWLRTGGAAESAKVGDVRALDGSGHVGGDKEELIEEEDEIPDMEDEEDDDEAIIRDTTDAASNKSFRTYNLYITYTPYYRTPRLYLSGYRGTSEPLAADAMMEDVMGDYKDKTVTLEDFPFFDTAQSIKMASIHPCKHASVMKTLLDRADAALRLRREKVAKGNGGARVGLGMEGLVDETSAMSLHDKPGYKAGVAAAGGNGGDEWEVLQREAGDGEDESAIRVDQYLIVFLKFVSSVTPTIEHDFTMGV